jgi:hypothetical protein
MHDLSSKRSKDHQLHVDSPVKTTPGLIDSIVLVDPMFSIVH